VYNQSATYYAARIARKRPVFLVFLDSSMTRRVYGKEIPVETMMGTSGGLEFWDATYLVGDGGTYGGIPVSFWGAYLLSVGSYAETLTPSGNNLLASLQQTEIPAILVTFDNTTGFFSELLGDDRGETLLLQTMTVYQYFPDSTFSDAQQIFRGEVSSLTLTPSVLVLTGEAV